MLLTDRCPWCDSLIPRVKFEEVQAKIRAEEQQKLEKVRHEIELEKKAAEQRVRAEAEKKVVAMAAERDRTMEKLSQMEAREASVRKVAEEEASLKLKGMLEDTEKRNQLKLDEARLVLEKDRDQKVASMAGERDRAVAKLREVEAREASIRKAVEDEATQKMKVILQEAEKRKEIELNQARLLLTKDRDQQILKIQSEFNREREASQKKLKEMERQLQRKTAHEMGDGAEIDVFEALRDAFPNDHVTRVPKGQPGADIHHEVTYKGQTCGRIVIDSKNRQAWQTAYVAKLRSDQVEAKAEYAILSTSVFPSGQKELCIEDGVVIVGPRYVVHIVSLLRRNLLSAHVRGLSHQQREGKKNKLYAFITSDAYTLKLSEARKLGEEIADLDVDEKRQHDNTWRKRGILATRMGSVLREIDTEVGAILEGGEHEAA